MTERSNRDHAAEYAAMLGLLYACACLGVLGKYVVDRAVVVIGLVVLVLLVREDGSAGSGSCRGHGDGAITASYTANSGAPSDATEQNNP